MRQRIRRSIITLFKDAIWLTGRFVAGVFPANRKHQRRILISRLDAIGDFILFAPSVRFLRNHFPDERIMLLVGETTRPLAESCPYVDVVKSVDVQRYKESALYRLRILIRTAVDGADQFLNPVYSREQIGDEIALWSRATVRVAWDADRSNLSPEEKVRGDALYSTLIHPAQGEVVHEAERNRKFLIQIGIDVPEYRLELWTTRSAIEQVEFLWSAHGLGGKTVVAIVPGAMHRFKSWGPAHFAELLRQLGSGREDLSFVLVGAQQDRGLLASMSSFPGVLDLCGQSPLDQLGEIFARCSLALGNDTGPLHIAAAAGVPVIALVGGGHYGRFFPYMPSLSKIDPVVMVHRMDCFGCNWRCIFDVEEGNPYPCVERIPVGAVCDAARSILFRSA